MSKHLVRIMFATMALAACERDSGITDPASPIGLSFQAGDNLVGAVYTSTNQAAGNGVAVFTRAAGGTLTSIGTVPTGGTGTGAGLGSQGAVVLSDDGQRLFVVNAGSNDVSVFDVRRDGLSLASRTPSGGIRPISLTVHGGLVYVLNAGGDGNISGFSVDGNGDLTPIPGSTRSLSGSATNPAEVAFSPDGRQLLVTEKATNLIDLYPVDLNGVAGQRNSLPSAGGTPFGFALGLRGLVFVSEAAGAGSASSYTLGNGSLTLVSGAVSTHQGAPCWAVVTRDGRFGYTGNTQGGSISGFAIATDGSISLLDADGVTATVGPGAIDLTVSRDSRYLYELVAGSPAIHAFRIQADGQLDPLAPIGGLPAGTVGLAAR